MSEPGSEPQLERIEPAKVTLSHQAAGSTDGERPARRLSPLGLGALALALGLFAQGLGLGARKGGRLAGRGRAWFCRGGWGSVLRKGFGDAAALR